MNLPLHIIIVLVLTPTVPAAIEITATWLLGVCSFEFIRSSPYTEPKQIAKADAFAIVKVDL